MVTQVLSSAYEVSSGAESPAHPLAAAHAREKERMREGWGERREGIFTR